MVDVSRHRPLDGSSPVNASVGTYEIGTLGCFVRVGSAATCILGSAHVLAGGTAQTDDVRIFQPPVSAARSEVVAELWDSYPPDLTGQSHSLLDAAIGVLSSGLSFDPSIGQLGRPTGFNTHMVMGERVRIHGAGSGRPTSGLIMEIGAEETVDYEGGGQASFLGLVRCERYSTAGDSGAAVLDANNKVVGVHLCGSGDYSWFCPIDMILARWPMIELIT